MKLSFPAFLKPIYVLMSFVLFWTIINLFSYSYVVSLEDKEHQKVFNDHYKVYSVNIPEKLDFAGENVPLEYFDVMESLDRELLVNTYWQSQSLLHIKRANRYFPYIDSILSANKIPVDFKYLCVAESGLMNVVSPSGATGFWQFMKETGIEYGLEINNEVDERYHFKKSTEAACKYLKTAYAKYKNWTLVAASYNMGMSGLEEQLARQKVDNYYDLLLNTETSRYVFRILSIKLIMENSTMFGFNYRPKDLYRNITTHQVKVDSAVTDFADFAKSMNTNYKMLKTFNPWLRQNFLTNKEKKTYFIEIPDQAARKGYLR